MRRLLAPMAVLVVLGISTSALAELPGAPSTAPPVPPGATAMGGTAPAAETGYLHGTPDTTASWTSRLYHQLTNRIVAIECGDGTGSGFLFHSRSHVATAFHVVAGCSEPTIVQRDGGTLTATVVAWDEEHDLALLQLEKPIDAEPLVLVGVDHGHVGEEVAVMGNPMGERWRQLEENKPAWAISRGVISAPPGDLVQTDAAINPGNSGGPLLTQDGRVVGVVSFIATGAQGISFAIAGKHLAALTKQIGKQGNYSPSKLSVDGGVAWLAAVDGGQAGALFLVRGLWDQTYALEFRIGVAGGVQQDQDIASVTKRERWFGEVTASYRLFASTAGALPIGVGLAWLRDDMEQSRYVVNVPPGCSGCSIGVTQESVPSTLERFRLVATLALDLRPIEIGGALYFLGNEDVGGRFNVGLVF